MGFHGVVPTGVDGSELGRSTATTYTDNTLLEDAEREICMKPIPLENMVLVGFGDSSFGKRPMESQVIVVY